MVDTYSATAADFDAAAQRRAHAFWVFLILAVIVWWFARGWWPTIPGVLAVYCGASSMHSTMLADRLRKGTFRLPNINNGAPDGDMRNIVDDGASEPRRGSGGQVGSNMIEQDCYARRMAAWC